MSDFQQEDLDWRGAINKECEQLVRWAFEEDQATRDWTTQALVPETAIGSAAVVARRQGVIAGLRCLSVVVQQMDRQVTYRFEVEDGARVEAGQVAARIEGPARSLLTAERVLLNMIGRLSGIATLTRAYVDAIEGTGARIYDTRKTTPGWRHLEKWAVRLGGGCNHRRGLGEGILIKDNHLAFGSTSYSPAEAVRIAREFVHRRVTVDQIIEVEVDTLKQLEQVLPAKPDIVLLDNMTPDQLRAAVQLRVGHPVQLEASGGITLENVRQVALTGVDRISVGALTHSAPSFDVGLDWGV